MRERVVTTADYWVGETIAEGSFGKVVHARHKASGEDAAIKVITKLSLQKDPSQMEIVLREKRLLTELKSDHIIQLWATFHDEQCVYFDLECSTSGDLSHLIRTGREKQDSWHPSIPVYGLQILSGLEYIHQRHVVHADLKPDNILMSSSGSLKLGDFGSAIELNNVSSIRFLGTADYASPELLRVSSKEIGVGVDLWSFGCLLYAMWEGQSPFHEKSDALAVEKVLGYREEPLRKAHDMPVHWAELVRALLSPDPSRRIGLCDYHGTGEEELIYASIRQHKSCWAFDVNRAKFRPPEPSWWVRTQANSTSLLDGAEGWSVFLL